MITFFRNLSLIQWAFIFFAINIISKSLLIDTIPTIITHDEMYYATEAKALVTTGSDVTGTWKPWSLSPANPIYAELTGVLQSVGFFLFPNNPLVALRFMPILLGSTIPLSLAWIGYSLIQRKKLFILTLLLATCNPWIFQFSRMGFDSIFSTALYLAGLAFLLQEKRSYQLVSIPLLFVGFFQYQGHKIVLMPLVALTLGYLFIRQTGWSLKKMKELPKQKLLTPFLILLIVIGITASYLIRLPSLQSSDRVNELAILDSQSLTEDVDAWRRLSLESPLLYLFENKITVLLFDSVKRLISSFDLKWLFIEGNARIDTFAVTRFGFFHFLDLILLVAGLTALISKKSYRSAALFLFLVTLVGTLPSVLKSEDVWLTFRGAFTMMGILLIVSVGSFELLSKLSFKKSLLILCSYLLLTLPFFYTYFFNYPVTTTKDTFLYNRVLANYAQRVAERNIAVVTLTPRVLFDSYLVYNNLITEEHIPAINTAYLTETFTLNNIQMTQECFDPAITYGDATIIVDRRMNICVTASISAYKPPIELSSIIDSGAQYDVYNDTLCDNPTLPEYISVNRDFLRLEKLSNEAFCQAFFIGNK